MNNKGLSLTELSVTVCITGTLLAASFISFETWLSKYKIETTLKEIYADLMKARVSALNTHTFYYMVLDTKSYTMYEDKDADSEPELGEEIASYPRKLDYALDWNGVGSKVTIDPRGQVTPNRTIWFASSLGPDYDCMTIFRTRILVGKSRYNRGTFAECLH